MAFVAACSDEHVDAICVLVNNGLWSIPRHQNGMNPARRKKRMSNHIFLNVDFLMPTEKRV